MSAMPASLKKALSYQHADVQTVVLELWNALTGITGGDVAGPTVAVTDDLVLFDGTTGKLVKDSGKTIAQLTTDILAAVAAVGYVVGPASAVNDHKAAFDGTTGKLIKDSGA